MEWITRLHDDDAQTAEWTFAGYTRQNTAQGQLFVSLAAESGAFAVRCYLRPDRDAASLVASGASPTAAGAVTLAAVNGSGLTGALSLDYRHDDSATALVVFYATDDDLTAFEKDLPALLDSAGQLAGRQGFERFTEQAKRQLDAWLDAALAARPGTPKLTHANLADPTVLREAASFAALAALYWHLKSDFEDGHYQTALAYQDRLERTLQHLPVPLDADLDGEPDAGSTLRRSAPRLGRG